ncbi:hypothetical protein PISL3812_05238 [Talaromyces islandicus]|uniref:rRNA adenine N(6)-methyltransferase n=1 Tax=Talaromyces islandicus TaxID=28573 RepID=A0A0U1LZQ6_TALIS|nr:hypothetical protein PISL3812_05238 [Talaromyces islandicus]
MRNCLIPRAQARLRVRQCSPAYGLPSKCGVRHSRFLQSAARKPSNEAIVSPFGKNWSSNKRIEVINEQFCDDVFERARPYLEDDRPSIILDINPGWGILSSKLNEKLQPDLHVLVEPRLRIYKTFLQELAKRKGVELYGEDIKYSSPGIDWMKILEKHVLHTEAAKKKNILFLTNFSDESLKMVPRIWSHFHTRTLLEHSILHDWRMRFIGVFDRDDAESIHPHQLGTRKKVAIQNVAAARHAFYLAEHDNRELIALRGYETITKSSAAVLKRAAEANVTTPAGREPIQHAPITEFPPSVIYPDRPQHYTENPLFLSIPLFRHRKEFNAAHDEYVAALESSEQARGKPADEKETDEKQTDKRQAAKKRTSEKSATKEVVSEAKLRKLRNQYTRAHSYYNYQLRNWDAAMSLNKKLNQIDRLELNLEAAWMNPTTPPEMLRDMDSTLREARKGWDVLFDKATRHTQVALRPYIDNYRASSGTSLQLIKGSNLAWDSRPFEPLLIRPGDTFRNSRPAAIFYMEPKNPEEILDILSIKIAHERLVEGIEMAHGVIHSFTTRSSEPISFMLEKLFPSESCTDTIKAIPELFRFIPKQLRESAIHAIPSDAESSTANQPPSPDRPLPMSMYDAFEYFPKQKNLNCLDPAVLFKLLRRYMEVMPPVARSCVMVHRTLGGTASQALIRQWTAEDD